MTSRNFFRYASFWLAILFTPLILAASTFIPDYQPYGYQAPVALSRNNVETGTAMAYVPWFETTNYTGELLGAPVSAGGIVNYFAPTWRASQTIDDKHWDLERRVFTRNDDTGLAVAFRYDVISKDQQKAVDEELVNYIRGDQSGETSGDLRERANLLGTIMHANPVYVGKPIRGYLFDNYMQFAADNKNRSPRVYVGANDGMLHAFNATDGSEEFAYIPSVLIPKLPDLAITKDFEPRYMVDGPLVAEDAYFGGAWHTVLVGGLGAGGQALFALDVTSASVASEADAATRLLWEFTVDDTDNLGYTYSRPSVVRLNNGSTAVVTGNGYMSKNGTAALLIIDISTGALIREIEVDDSDDNGLSSPTLIDTDGDLIADVAYAGDLNGNLWKFDLSDANPTNWAPAWDTTPLFITEYDSGIKERQAITTAPTVGLHPEGGYFVYVATGRLLAVEDAEDKYALAPQSFYGIWDNSPGVFDLPYETIDLLQQSLLVKTHPDDTESVRTATANPPDWTVHKGWATRLDAGGAVPGTRVLTDHTLRQGRLQFTTIDPTTGSGVNYLMQLNANTGGSPTKTVLDVDGNGKLDINDNLDGDGDGVVENTATDRVVGQYLSFGVASAPVVAAIGGDDVAIVNKLYSILSYDFPGDDPEEEEDPGLSGGHIDVDTSHMIYDFDDGSTDAHAHQWDDKHATTVVNFFDLLDEKFQTIDQPGMKPKQGNQTFLITVTNAHLSPGAVIEINGAAQPVKEYRAKIKRYLAGNLGEWETFPRYKLSEPNAKEQAEGIVQLTDFKMSFDKDGILIGGVHPTATGCVRGNEPGQNNEYRNGALTIQALDANKVTEEYLFNPLNSAYETVSHAIHEDGQAVSRVGSDDGSLYWETTIFWHWSGGCFGIDDAEKYNANYKELVTDVDRGTDDDISSDPVPPPHPDDPEDPAEEDESSATTSVSTTVIAGGSTGRLSWRELMIDE